ncbi:hypothetical protein K9T45_000994 [Campylobacter jejuni]|nr:hypothetical protein [Campylobacter jejuni]
MESDFLEKIPFIDEVLIYKDDFLEKIQSKNTVIFITTRRQGLYFKN